MEIAARINYQQLVEAYVDKQEYMTPIYNEDIYEFAMQRIPNANIDEIKYTLNVCLARLEKQNQELIRFQKGVYYKAKNTVFGYARLDPMQVARNKYLQNKDEIIGYETGPSLFTKVGLTTQIPRYAYFATNKCAVRGQQIDEALKVTITKPLIEVTRENYRYLQVIELLLNRFRINIEVDNREKLIYNYILQYDIKAEDLLRYCGFLDNDKINNELVNVYSKGKSKE